MVSAARSLAPSAGHRLAAPAARRSAQGRHRTAVPAASRKSARAERRRSAPAERKSGASRHSSATALVLAPAVRKLVLWERRSALAGRRVALRALVARAAERLRTRGFRRAQGFGRSRALR